MSAAVNSTRSQSWINAHNCPADGDDWAGGVHAPGQLWERMAETDAEREYYRKLIMGEWTLRRVRHAQGRAGFVRVNGQIARHGRGPVVGYGVSQHPHILRVAPAASGIISAGVRVK